MPEPTRHGPASEPAVTDARQAPETARDGEATGAHLPQSGTPPAELLPPTPPAGGKAAEPALPQVRGYEVLEVLGRGGMGVVYKARHLALGRTVALKMLRSGAPASSAEAERFAREARAAAQLHHPQLVPVYEVGSTQYGQPYFSMAYVGGDSLARHLGRYVGDPRAAATLLEKVARGVQHAHERGVLHRDLKPGNILLDERGEPLVSDFGLAKLRDAELELTQPGMVLGTPRYMAPEQTTGRPDQITAASDIWALGVILYELLTGTWPFAGQSREQLLHDIQNSTPPRPRSLRAKVPRDLETICLKCLEKEPARRYASAGALADDLVRWLAGEPIVARRTAWSRRLWRTARRHPLISATTVLLVLVSVAVPVWRHFTDPNLPLYEDLQKLARGEPAILIGTPGQPRWLRWPTGESGTGLKPGDGYFYFHTSTYSLLELMPDPGIECYRFRAEVRHDLDLSHEGEVGIYFGHRLQPVAAGLAHLFLKLDFSDSWNSKKTAKGAGGQVFHRTRLSFDYYRPESPGFPKNDYGILLGSPRFYELSLPETERPPWRKLAVEISPEEVRSFWEGDPKPFSRVSRQQLEKFADRCLQVKQEVLRDEPEGKKIRYEFRPQSAIGLYAYNSTISFRNVVIEPLPKQN
jgi:serine/threonine-protein kinase